MGVTMVPISLLVGATLADGFGNCAQSVTWCSSSFSAYPVQVQATSRAEGIVSYRHIVLCWWRALWYFREKLTWDEAYTRRTRGRWLGQTWDQ
jgi:hypothetical protein